METGFVTIQEPVSTKTNIEEAPSGVILDHSSMKVDKVNLSTVLDDEITSRDCRSNIIPGEADVSEVVNGSGNNEIEETERKKGEAMKTISVVEDSKIVKEKASGTENDEQGSIFVHEPESFDKNTEDAKIILSDVTLEKEKEDDIIEKPEEVNVEVAVIEEYQTDTKHSPKIEAEIGNISKVLIDTTTVKVDEYDIQKSFNSAREEIPIKTDEVKEEKDSRTVETSVNGTEAEHKATVSVEEISRNGENIVNETVQEETATGGDSLDGVETTKRVLFEVKKEEEEAEMNTDAEPLIKTVVEEAKIVGNEETTAHESKSLKEKGEPVEALKNSDDSEQITREVTVDKEKEGDITQNTEEVQESVRVIETPTIQGEGIESKASLNHGEEIVQSSKDIEEHEHVLVRDIPQGETLVTEAETVDTSTIQEAEILKTNINKTEEHSAMGGEEEGQETQENTKLSLDLKEDKEQEETERVKTIVSSDEVRSSDVQVEEFSEHIEPHSSETKDESHGRAESVEVKSKETVQEESTQEKYENILDVAPTESVKFQDNKPETSLISNIEIREKFGDSPSDLAIDVDKEELKDEKVNVDQVDGTPILEEQRGLDANEPKAEKIDQNRSDETEESQVVKLIALPDVEELVEQMQKPPIESPSEVSKEISKTVEGKVEEKPEEEVTLQQEGQVEGYNGLEIKEETISVPESIELGEQSQEERSVIDLTPLNEELSQPNEQEKETKLENHEPTNEEVKSDEVIEVLTVVQAETIENIKENEEEQAVDKILKSLETVKTVESHSSLPSSSEEKEHGTVSEMIEDEKVKEEVPMVQIKSEDGTTKNHEKQEESSKTGETTVVQAEQTRDIGPSLTAKEEAGAEMKTDAEPKLDETEKEEIETVKTVVEEAKIVNNEETKAYESESLKRDDHHDEYTEEKIGKISKDTEEHELVLGRDIPQYETLEAEAVEAKEDSKPSPDKEDKEQEVAETTKTVIFSDEVRPSDQVDVQADEFSEHSEPFSSEIKDESHGREESVEVKTKETVQEKIIEEKHENPLDVPSTESEKHQDNKPETTIVANTENQEKFEDIPSDLAFNVDKEELKDENINVDQVDGTQIMEKQRGLDSNGAEAEKVDQNRTDETKESPVAKLVVLPDVEESVEQMQKLSLESLSEVSEETSKTKDEKIEEETTLRREGQEEGSFGLETKEETVSVPVSKELGEHANEERTLIDLNPLQEESSKPNETEKETMLEKHESTNEEVSSESFKGDDNKGENAESVEAIKNSHDAEQISCEVTGDIEKEEDINQKTKEVQESPQVIENPREDIDSKASLELKEEVDQSSKDTEEHEHVLGREIPQCDQTLEAEAVDSLTVQEAAILKTLETNIIEKEAVHSAIGGAEECQEKIEDTETSLDMKVDKEQKEAETVKTVIFSDEVRSSDQVDAQEEELGEHIGTCISEIKYESQGREESVEVKSKETVQDESSEEKDVNLLDVRSGDSENFIDNEPETTLVSKTESQEKSEEIPSDLGLKDELMDEKTNADQVDETQTMVVQRGPDLNEPEAEQIDQNRTDETEESSVEKLVVVKGSGLDEIPHNETVLDVESVEKVQKPSLETPEISEETSKSVDGKIEDKLKEEVTLDQEDQEEGSNGLETKEETVSVLEESCLPNEKENETKLQEKNELTNEKVSNDQHSSAEETSDEVIQVSSASTSEKRESETIVEAEKIGDEKVDGEEPVAEKIQRGLETVEIVEPHSLLLSSLEEQEHGTVFEKTDDKKVKDAEPMGDMSKKGLEIAETTDVSLPSVDQKEDIKAFDKEIHIPSVALPWDEQENVTSSEKEETKANETAEAKKEDEEITVSTSKTSENVCIQQEEFGKLIAPKLEEPKEDKSLEIAETIKATEATSDQTLPIETSDEDNTLSSELVSEEKDQTPKQVEEIHEQETEEAHKLQAEKILSTEIPRESSDEALASMLASKEDDQVTLQEDNFADDVRETKDTEEERSVSVETEEIVGETEPKKPEDDHVEAPTSDNETLIAEAKKGDEDITETETTMALDTSGTSATSENVGIKKEELGNHESPKVEESKQEKTQEILETVEAIEATGDQTLNIEKSQVDQTLNIEKSQVDQTLSSELVSGLDDQTPRQVEEIHEEETKEKRKFEATCDQSLPVETSQVDQTLSSELVSELDEQTPRHVEEIHEEETKEEHKLQVAVDQILLVETSQADQTPSLVSEILEEETKEIHKVQAEDTAPRESFSEAPVSMLASGEDEPVTLQKGKFSDDTKEEQHVSAETEEKVVETKPKEPEAEGTKKSDDQVETSTKFTEVENENTKKTDIEVAELTDYCTGEAEHEDENSSNLPVVEILKGLHKLPFETERELNDTISLGENIIIEPAEKVLKKGDAEVESNEKDFASDIIEELNLQEEDKEKVKVQDSRSREFEVNVEEKLQEETREIAECKEEVPADLSLTEVLPVVKILTPSSPLPSKELEHVISEEKQEEREPQQDINALITEKISLKEEHPKDFETSKEQKEETHETVKEEDQIVDMKEEQDEKLWDSSATRDIEEIFSSEVKDDKEDVEKEEAPHSVLGSEEEINEVVTSEKQITDPVGVITKASEAEHESNEEHIETQVILDDTESNDDRDFPTEEEPKDQKDEVSADTSLTKEALVEKIQVPSSALLDDQDFSVKKPSELIQPHQSANQVEETSFEVKKEEEDKNEDTGDALIIKKNVQVQDQPKDFEASVTDKETSEQEQKSNDLKEDIGINVKLEVHDNDVRCDGHDSVVVPKEETGLTEEKREVEQVKTDLEDAVQHAVSVEEKNNTSEKIDREATKEINQEENKQTCTVKEEIREEDKETTQECFNISKNTDDAIEKTEPKIQDIESLSSVSNTQDKPEQKDEIPNQQTREIAVEVPKIAEQVHKKDGESKNKKDLFSEVKESEPTEKESERKSLSDLIQKVKGTTKTEDTTTEPHIEENLKTEEEENEDEDHEHNKDDKTSPDSIVVVDAKDTVSIIKTHKKSQGILSGVGSKVKHSISKVKKVLTGKSSHTTKPSSPK